jgi:hypothetical protein
MRITALVGLYEFVEKIEAKQDVLQREVDEIFTGSQKLGR